VDAMAGRMFVASDVGGHRELVRHVEMGFLFPAGDALRLADSIDGVLARKHDWRRIRARLGALSKPSARGRAALRAMPIYTRRFADPRAGRRI
jgi:hypothetical protein